MAMAVSEEYTILPLTVEDEEEVRRIVSLSFTKDEPLSNFLKIIDTPDGRCSEIEDYAVLSISQGNSLKAVTASGKIVGVRINGLMTREEHSVEPPDSDKELTKYKDQKFLKILKLLKKVYWDANPFQRFPQVQKVLDIRVTSVEEKYRCLGIAKAFSDRTKELARELGCQLVRTDCTSAFSAKVAERRGFQLLYRLPYSEYLDSEGNPVFSPESPHVAVNSFICWV